MEPYACVETQWNRSINDMKIASMASKARTLAFIIPIVY